MRSWRERPGGSFASLQSLSISASWPVPRTCTTACVTTWRLMPGTLNQRTITIALHKSCRWHPSGLQLFHFSNHSLVSSLSNTSFGYKASNSRRISGYITKTEDSCWNSRVKLGNSMGNSVAVAFIVLRACGSTKEPINFCGRSHMPSKL